MSAALTLTPASGSIVSTKSIVRVDVTGAASNDTTGYDTTKYPTEPEIRYYIQAVASGQPTLKSYAFAPAPGGTHSLNSLVFPGAATWTVTLNKVSDDSAVATASVTVS